MNEDSKTERGRFRSVDIRLLQESDSDPRWDAEPTKLVYAYPVQSDDGILYAAARILANGISPEELDQYGGFITCASPQSHIACFRNAIDFLIPDGTPVLAMQDGCVVEVQETSERWGDSPEYADYLNYMTIEHPNGEFSQYCHLAKESAARLGISPGTPVRKSQEIATVGKTGWTDRDHLHVVVFRLDNNPFGFKSHKIKFQHP